MTDLREIEKQEANQEDLDVIQNSNGGQGGNDLEIDKNQFIEII